MQGKRRPYYAVSSWRMSI